MIPQKERRNEEGGFVVLSFDVERAGQIHIPRTQHALARLVADNAFVRFEESDTGRGLMEDDDELSLCQEGPRRVLSWFRKRTTRTTIGKMLLWLTTVIAANLQTTRMDRTSLN